MGKLILDESQLDSVTNDDLATMRVYVSATSKRAVVAEDDDLLAEKDIAENPKQVADPLWR